MSLYKITEVGKTLHSEYIDTRLTNATVPVSQTIKINSLAIVQTHERKERTLKCQNRILLSPPNFLYLLCRDHKQI